MARRIARPDKTPQQIMSQCSLANGMAMNVYVPGQQTRAVQPRWCGPTCMFRGQGWVSGLRVL